MKPTKNFNITKKLFWGILAAVMLLSFNSCVRRVSFLTSTVAPAARGYVKVKKDSNENYVIQMQLFNLAEVKRMDSSKESYVVWMVNDQDKASNLGQINSSSSTFSRKLKASMITVATEKPNKIFITAENDGNTSYPGSVVVLTTDNF